MDLKIGGVFGDAYQNIITTIQPEDGEEDPPWLGPVVVIGLFSVIIIVLCLLSNCIEPFCKKCQGPGHEPELIQVVHIHHNNSGVPGSNDNDRIGPNLIRIIHDHSDLPQNYNVSGISPQRRTGSPNENNNEIATIFRLATRVSPPNDEPPSYEAIEMDLPTYDEIDLQNLQSDNNQLVDTTIFFSETEC